MSCNVCGKNVNKLITSQQDSCECLSDNWRNPKPASTELSILDEFPMDRCDTNLKDISEDQLHQDVSQERSIFRCTVCNRDYLSKEGLWKHLDLHMLTDDTKNENYEEKLVSHEMYECGECGDQSHYQENDYWKHIKEEHTRLPAENISIKCECPSCGDIFSNGDLLAKHVDENHRMFVCGICATTFSNEGELEDHKSIHHLEKSYSCPHCPEKVTDEKVFERHLDRCAKKKYSCEMCDAKFVTLRYLKKHQLQVHNKESSQTESVADSNNDGESRFSLDEVVAPVNYDIKMEIAIEESTLQPLDHQAQDLTFCEFIITDVDQLENPEKQLLDDSNTAEKVDVAPKRRNEKQCRIYKVKNKTFFECMLCNESFHKYTAYRWHKTKFHTAPKYTCPHCSKRLWKETNFQNHVAKCALTKFPCEFCRRKYPTKEAVDFHTKECHQIQEVALVTFPADTMPNVTVKCECAICGDFFGNGDLLFEHMKEHHGHSVKCTLCTSTFSGDDELISHMRDDHDRVHDINKPNLSSELRCLTVGDQTLYECVPCKITFSSLNRYSLHKENIHQKPKYKCPNCSQQFTRKIPYLKHKGRCAVKILTKCECPICCEVFSNGFVLSNHVQASHQMTICTICTMTFTDDFDLFNHKLITHPESLSSTVSCPHCPKIFHKSERLNRHLESCGPRVCKVCDKQFSKFGNFMAHMNAQHPDMLYSCPLCAKKFVEEITFQKHSGYCAERKYSCSQCDTARKTLREFKLHVAATGHDSEPVIESQVLHTKIQLPCPICKTVFRSANTRRFHMATAHKEPHIKCPKCDKAFHYKSRLAQHLLNHDKITPVETQKTSHEKPNSFKCSKCDKTFNFKCRLMRHLATHDENEPKPIANRRPLSSSFPCLHCSKLLPTSDMLNRHLESCGPRVCDLCEQKFPDHGNFMAHMKSHHPDKIHSCPLCSRKFVEESTFDSHLGYCAERRYSCSQCDTKRKTLREFKRHVALTGHKGGPMVDFQEILKNLKLPCSICNMVFRSVNTRRSHMATAHKEPHIKCPKCDRAFHYKSRLMKHLLNHDKPITKTVRPKLSQPVAHRKKLPTGFQCPHCSKSWRTSKMLNHHLKTCGPRICNYCDQELPNDAYFMAHMSAYHPQMMHSCPFCSERFTEETKFESHIGHCAERKYSCSECDVKRMTLREFKRHVALSGHADKPVVYFQDVQFQLPCPICKVVFRSVNTRRCHIATAHKEPHLKCPKCDRAFHFKSRLMSHLRYHDKTVIKTAIPKPAQPVAHRKKMLTTFQCPHCSKSWRTSEMLNIHLKSCGPRICNYCDQEFPNHGCFMAHMNGSHPDMMNSCPFCSERFIEEIKFEKHVAYCAERKYSCGQCDVKRKTLREFNHHIAVSGHVGEPVVESQEIRLQLPCPICKVVFRSFHTRRFHMATAHKEPHIKCPKCDKAFHYQSRLVKHLENHDKEQIKVERPKQSQAKLPKTRKVIRKKQPVPCSKCHAVFRSNSYLRYHMRIVHEERRLKCPKCEKTFHFNSRLLEHLRTHDNKKAQKPKNITTNQPLSCSLCKKQFTSVNSWKNHKATAHKEAHIKCPKCAKAFHFKSKMMEHLLTHHKVQVKKEPKEPSPRQFTCPTCNVVFSSANAWKNHKATAHREPRFKCSRCEKAFHFQSRLLAHLRFHDRMELTAMKPKEPKKKKLLKKPKTIRSGNYFPCNMCNVVFSSYDARRYHKSTAHVEPRIKCPKCEKAFHYRSQLLRHLQFHSNMESQTGDDNAPKKKCKKILKREYTCPVCQLVFSSVNLWKHHKATAHQEPRFKCSMCEKAFHFRSKLVVHLRLHNGVVNKPQDTQVSQPMEQSPPNHAEDHFPCPICKVEFRSHDARRYHTATAHVEPRIKCPKCEKAFHFRSQLLTHLQNHDKINPQMSKPKHPQNQSTKKPKVILDYFLCSICNALFRSRNALRYHKATIHVEPTVQCPKCDKAFHYRSLLLRHMRTHAGIKLNGKNTKQSKVVLD